MELRTNRPDFIEDGWEVDFSTVFGHEIDDPLSVNLFLRKTGSTLTLPIGCAECSFIPELECMYFNRLFVKEPYRGHGYGTFLIDTLLFMLAEKGLNIILDINPYGDMSYEDLEKFYMKHGFERYDVEGIPRYICWPRNIHNSGTE